MAVVEHGKFQLGDKLVLTVKTLGERTIVDIRRFNADPSNQKFASTFLYPSQFQNLKKEVDGDKDNFFNLYYGGQPTDEAEWERMRGPKKDIGYGAYVTASGLGKIVIVAQSKSGPKEVDMDQAQFEEMKKLDTAIGQAIEVAKSSKVIPTQNDHAVGPEKKKQNGRKKCVVGADKALKLVQEDAGQKRKDASTQTTASDEKKSKIEK